MISRSEPVSGKTGLKALGRIVLGLVTLVSFAPVIGLVLALTVANALQCQLDEGSEHLCLLGRVDIGGVLYTGGVLGWLALVTWPGMIISLGLWAFLGIRWIVRRGRRRPAPPI